MKIKALSLLSCLLLCLACHSQNAVPLSTTPLKIEKKDSYPTSQPYYQIDFSAAYCFVEIRINDVLVFSFNLDGQTSSMIPANSAILQSGKQQVTVKVLPLSGQKLLHPSASFRYNIKVFDAANELNFKSQLPGEFAVAKVDPAKKQTILTQTSTFDAEVPYTIAAYQTGKDLRSTTGLKEKLYDYYRKLEALINQGNTEELKKLIGNREQFAATTMYLSQKESDDRISHFLKELNGDFKLSPLAVNAIVKISGNGKLATLVKPDGEPLLVLRNEKEHEEMGLEFTFYIPVGKDSLEII